MTDERKDLPQPTATNFSQRLRETVMTYLGRQGSPLDRGLTLRDLINAGVIAIKGGTSLRLGTGTIPIIPGSGVDNDNTVYVPDLTPPPTPTGFTASAGITNLMLEVDAALYMQGHGHGVTVVYGAIYTTGALPVFQDAVELTQFQGTVSSISTNPATQWHLWAKWKSVDDVLSTDPAGGTNGVVVTTGQDVSKLLTVLADQITTSELSQALNTRIDLIDGNGVGSVNDRIAIEASAQAQALAAEAQARVDAVAQEVIDRNAAIAAEALARSNDLANEATLRADAIAGEAALRTAQIIEEQRVRGEQVTQNAQTLLQNILNQEALRDSSGRDLALARSELTTDLVDGLSAEATARLALASVVDTNAALLVSEQQTRASADEALASDVTTLFAQSADATAAINAESLARTSADSALTSQITTLSSAVDGNAANLTTEQATRASAVEALADQISTLTATVVGNTSAIATEATARSDADTSEANARTTLASQILGADGTSLTSGLLYEERSTRAAEDNSLAQQITLLSAGAGEQFDWNAIWYFDSGVEGWAGNGTPTASNGWLRPANQASGAYVESPAGLATEAAKYGQVRLRVRKVGAPTWAAYLWWRTPTDGTWDAARRIGLDAPTYDANGIGLVTVSPAWSGTIDRIRVDLSSAQTATDYFEMDWVAVGRPSPGASSAQLLAESLARASADTAETTARQTLSSKLTGTTDPSSLTLETLSSGLLYDESTARSTQDTSLATSISTLSATVGTNQSTNEANLTAEQTARANADSAEVTARQALSSTLVGTTDPNGLTLETLSSGLLFDERSARSSQDTAIASSVTSLQTTVTDNANTFASAITDEATARSAADSTEADKRSSLSSLLTGEADPTGLTLETLASGLLFDEKTTRVSADSAMSTNISGLQSTVGDLQSDLTTEQTTRSNADSAMASDITSLVAANRKLTEADVKAAETALFGVVNLDSERKARELNLALARQEFQTDIVDGLSAEASARLQLGVIVDANTAALTVEQQTRASQDEAIASSVTALTAVVDTNTAAILTESTTRATQDEAIASSVTALTAVVNDNAASVTNDITALASDLTAETTARTTLASTVGENTAAIQTEASTRATETGDLQAKYTVKVDVGGRVSGFGLASTANDATPTSEFAIVADKFSIAPVQTDNTVNDGHPFFYRTTATTINGVSVPAGAYMKAAFIHDASITNAKIKDATIDSAKIASLAADKITAGSLAVGQYIQSSNYVVGTTGWRINADGTAEFSGVIARGTIDGATINGGVITGATMQTDTTGQRIVLDDNGLLFLTGATSGKYGTFKYGAKKYGSGVLVYFNDRTKKVPFYVSGEQNVADIHLYNRGANPTGGTYEDGDMIVVGGRLRIYVAALGGWKQVALE